MHGVGACLKVGDIDYIVINASNNKYQAINMVTLKVDSLDNNAEIEYYGTYAYPNKLYELVREINEARDEIGKLHKWIKI